MTLAHLLVTSEPYVAVFVGGATLTAISLASAHCNQRRMREMERESAAMRRRLDVAPLEQWRQDAARMWAERGRLERMSLNEAIRYASTKTQDELKVVMSASQPSSKPNSQPPNRRRRTKSEIARAKAEAEYETWINPTRKVRRP